MRVTDKHVFFWGEWPSNWYSTTFTATVNGQEYKFYNSEQYFMFMKAITFGDTKMAEQISKFGSNPRTAKALGRKVQGYDDKVWDEKRFGIMLDANLLKFTQNEKLKKTILSDEFEGKGFVEASPVDTIWGIGCDEVTALDDESNWRGQNLLGKVLDETRKKLKEINQI